VIFGLVGRYVLPYVAEQSGFSLELYADIIVAALALMTPQISGALLGFSILDDRDDNILLSVKTTPLSIHQYISFKLIVVFVLAFLSTVFIIWFAQIGNLTVTSILSISLLTALGTPVLGLLINAFARNKIEGFAIMKGLGMLLAFPVAALFFFDKRELIFAFAPGFWPAKVISTLIRGEGFLPFTLNQYYFFGLLYVMTLNVLVYRFFLHRTRT
jgi:fluoroquinolone transport system permease protein